QIKLRAMVGTEGITRALDFDVGETFEVYARRVDVAAMAPVGAMQVTTQNAGSLSLSSALVADTFIGVALNPIEESRGKTTMRYTQVISAEAGQSATITVPRYATAVRFSQDSNGGLPVQFSRYAGDPNVL